MHEERIMAVWRKLSKIFNEPQSGIPIYMAYEPVISEKIITQEYYEKLMNGEFSITKIIRIISYACLKKLPKLKKDQTFVPLRESFIQIILASQSFYPIDEGECKRAQMTIFKIKNVWVNKLRRFGDEKEPRVFPIVNDERLINKLMYGLHRNEGAMHNFMSRLHNSVEAVLRLIFLMNIGYIQ